jgi:hypothetical protein
LDALFVGLPIEKLGLADHVEYKSVKGVWHAGVRPAGLGADVLMPRGADGVDAALRLLDERARELKSPGAPPTAVDQG